MTTTTQTIQASKRPAMKRNRPGKHLSPATQPPKNMRQCDSSGTNDEKNVRFAESTTILPAQSTSHPETWYQAADYSSFLQVRRVALAFLLESLVKDDTVHASAFLGLEQQLSQEHFIARKLQCLQYIQLVVCQQYMKDCCNEIEAATRQFAMDASHQAHLRAMTASQED